jgi:hypothetical protein
LTLHSAAAIGLLLLLLLLLTSLDSREQLVLFLHTPFPAGQN